MAPCTIVGAKEGSSRTPAETRVGRSTLRIPRQAAVVSAATIRAIAVRAARAPSRESDIDAIRVFMISSMPLEGEPEGRHELGQRRHHRLDVVGELTARYSDLRVRDDLAVDVLLRPPERGEVAT